MIEWSRVRELRDEVGEEDFSDVVELFLEEVEEVIDRLDRQPEQDRLEHDLHFLKGSALCLGFRDFSQLCQNGEKKSAQGYGESVDLGEIIGGYRTSKSLFLEGVQAECLS